MHYASRNLFTSTCELPHCCDWRIPAPNRSPCFEVSAVFPFQKFDDLRRNAWISVVLTLAYFCYYLYGITTAFVCCNWHNRQVL